MESMALAGAGLTTAFGELLKAVIETKHVAVGFSSILNRLQVTIESLIPILKKIDELKIEVDYGTDIEALLKEGVDLVRKCSKVTRLNLYKRTKYTTELQELDDSIIRFVKKHYPDTLSEKSDEERVGGVEAKLENSSNLSHDSETDGFSISTGGTDLSSVTSKASYSVGKGWTDLSSMTSKASSFSVPSSKAGKENTATSPSMPRSPGRAENPTSLRSRWKKGKLLGRGTFGHVYVVFHSETGAMGAMKEATLFSDDAKSKESAKQLVQEISILSNLRHPNIVQYYGAETVDDKLYIFQEYVSGGSIFKLLQDYGQFGEPAICGYTQEILSGLAYLHAKNIVHRDIKGANILVDPNGRVKLADFGVADHITRQSCPSLSFKGSPYWMAPEVIKNSNGCNLAVDIWSLGCTILEMATTKPPWSQFEGVAAMFKIGNSQELPVIPDHLSIEGKDFVRQCLQRNPLHRPTAAQLLEHRFMKKASLAYSGSMPSWHSDPPPGVKNGVKSLGIGQARNLSSLDSESLLQGIGQARNHSSLDSESLQSIQLEF